MKKIISLILTGIMLISSCIIADAAVRTISFDLPDGRIYSDITILDTTITGDSEVKEVIFYLDGNQIGTSDNGSLDITSGTITPGNHTLEAIALFDDGTAAVDKKTVNVYKRYPTNVNPFALGSNWAGRTVTPVTGKFGDSTEKTSYGVQFNSGGALEEQNLATPINCGYGDIITFGFSVGADDVLDFASETASSPTWYTGEIATFGIHFEALDKDGKPVTVKEGSCGIGINFYGGGLSKRDNAENLPSDYKTLACNVGIWNKYEFRYVVGRGIPTDEDYVPNKLTIYKDGTEILKNYTIGTANINAITKLNGISMFERGRANTLYFEDIFIDYQKTDYGIESLSYSKDGGWTAFTNDLPSDAEQLKVKFNKAMNDTSFTTSNISLVSDKGTKTISDISVSSDCTEAVIDISEGFSKGEKLQLILSENLQDSSGTAVGEKLYMNFKTEAAPLTPDNAEYSVNTDSALVSTRQLKNGDTVTVKFDLDIEGTSGVAAYLCVRENKRLVSIKPCSITSGGSDLSISTPVNGLKGEGNIEVKLIICDDFITTKPYSMIKLD